jgi:ABC-2 type transport system permease protein
VLWQNAFLDTRWRFLAGLVLLTVSAMFVALGYPNVAEVAKAVPVAPTGGRLGREIAEALALSRTYDGYVWSQWFRQNGSQLGSFFAIIIGTGGLLSQSSAARLFTLSLPVTRERLLGARAAAGLAQVLALSVVPALVITLVSPFVGERFPLLDTLVYALCLFAGCAVFFSVAFLLSTLFANVWAPAVLALCVGPVAGAVDQITGGPTAFSLLAMMHGEPYFRGSGLPWPMLLVSAVLSAALIYAGVRLIARRDF